MSYCRWSSDNWKSDIYCYEGVDNKIHIHVAASKRLNVPEANWTEDKPIEQYMEELRIQSEYLKTAELVPIGLTWDGDSFECDGYQEALDVLLHLQDQGYHVPQFAIECLKEEIEE